MNKLRETHPLAGQEVKIKQGQMKGVIIRVEDWWQNVYGDSWGETTGNPACMQYALRIVNQDFYVPPDDEVIYGKIGSLGHLVHVTELEEQELHE